MVKGFFEKLGLRLVRQKNLPQGTDAHLYSFASINSLPIEVIFDIGANIGQTAIKFAHNFPKAKIFSFELLEITFEELKKNIKKLPNISCFQIAFGSEVGKSIVYLAPDSQWNSLVSDINKPQVSNSPYEEVIVETIEKFCQDNNINRIDILKTDTEGFDLNIIKGSENFLKTSKISFILSEVGFDLSDKRHTNYFLLKSYLENFGFEFLGFYDFGYNQKGVLKYCNALFINKKASTTVAS